jgi:hypothetical protein
LALTFNMNILAKSKSYAKTVGFKPSVCLGRSTVELIRPSELTAIRCLFLSLHAVKYYVRGAVEEDLNPNSETGGEVRGL